MEFIHICDDCDEGTDWMHAVQLDPWGNYYGLTLCENCAEKRWQRQQEKAVEA